MADDIAQWVAYLPVALMVVLMGFMIYLRVGWNRLDQRRDERWKAEWRKRRSEEVATVMAASILEIRSAVLSPPQSWTRNHCQRLECKCLSENWAYDAEDAGGCYCMWRMLAPTEGEIAGVCEDLCIEGPDERDLSGELAFAWALYQSRNAGTADGDGIDDEGH